LSEVGDVLLPTTMHSTHVKILNKMLDICEKRVRNTTMFWLAAILEILLIKKWNDTTIIFHLMTLNKLFQQFLFIRILLLIAQEMVIAPLQKKLQFKNSLVDFYSN
jgi:hypothetical protein